MTTPAPKPFEDFWLKYDNGPWRQVSKEDYLRAEWTAGFYGGGPGEPATASFGRTTDDGHSVRGSTFKPLDAE